MPGPRTILLASVSVLVGCGMLLFLGDRTTRPSRLRSRSAQVHGDSTDSPRGDLPSACWVRQGAPLDPRPLQASEQTPTQESDLAQELVDLLAAGEFARLGEVLGTAAPEALAAAMTHEAVARIEDEFTTLPLQGRRLAAWCLAHSPLPEVSVFLSARLRTESEVDVRCSLVLALQLREDDEAFQGLGTALALDPSEEVRCASTYALACLSRQDRPAGPFLRRALTLDRSSSVRAAAAAALALIPSREAAEALMAALDSPDADVRCAAAASLGTQAGFVPPEAVERRSGTETDERVRAALAESVLALRGELTVGAIGGCEKEPDEASGK